MGKEIYTIGNKKEESFLRKKTLPFKFSDGVFSVANDKFTKRELSDLIGTMKDAMIKANGVGLSANQIGLPYRLFVAKIPSQHGQNKLYAVLNPEIEKASGETALMEEGCLSIPKKYGGVPRYPQLWIKGLDKNGKQLRMKAWGLLSHVFQHEIDHLNGGLFIDKAREIYESPKESGGK